MHVLLHKSQFCSVSRYYHQPAEYANKCIRMKKILEAVNLSAAETMGLYEGRRNPGSVTICTCTAVIYEYV